MGYRALFANEPYAATAEAVETTTTCGIPKTTLFALLEKSPQLSFQILKKLSKELRTSEEKMLSLVQESVKQRTARLLLSFWEKSGGNLRIEAQIRVPLLRKEMSQIIGTTPETFSRTLHHFAQRGIVRLTRSEIFLTNLEALQMLAPKS